MSWCEIFICIVAATVLFKMLKDNYNEKYGKK
jgi:hypothetical protein